MEKNNSVDWKQEEEHLQQTVNILEKQIVAVQGNTQKNKENLIRSRKDMWENTVHFSNDFDRLVDTVQYLQQLNIETHAYTSEVLELRALQRMLENPYFARIDFQSDGERDFEKIYIGRSSLRDRLTYEIHVFDWRAPIASLFYQFETGPVFYQAPVGKITGQVNLKRQFEIRQGNLIYFFDADVQIMDEFLRKLLSQNTSANMKTIVETIQKDQDRIIRDQENELVMVQGVAGSGKTSVALHRIAYLLYQGLANKLLAQEVIILSPNRIFEQYIAHVLPELGENNVVSTVFEDLCGQVLSPDIPRARVQNRNQWLEDLLEQPEGLRKKQMRSSLQFKTSSAFVKILQRYVQDLPRKKIPFQNIYYCGQYVGQRHLLKSQILNRKKELPLGIRLQQLEHNILEKVHKIRPERILNLEEFVKEFTDHVYDAKEFARLLSIQESTRLLGQIRSFTQLDSLSLYGELFQDEVYFRRLARDLDLPSDLGTLCRQTREHLVQVKSQKASLHYEDALGLTFFKLLLWGFHGFKDIRQVVVDEAQDYCPLHFEIMQLMFPKTWYTVLGDISQTIEQAKDLTLYTEMQRIFQKETSLLLTLQKSFRSTKDILAFSSRFLPPDQEIVSFSRPGDPPQIHVGETPAELKEILLRQIEQREGQGYQSLGIICKSEKEARILYAQLWQSRKIQLINQGHNGEIKGVFIIPVYLAKGLEFDAVFVYNVDAKRYSRSEDRNLLYIACTRALHQLDLFYTGLKSPFL